MQPEHFHLHAELEDRHWWFVGRRRVMRRLVHALLPPRRGDVVVDIGCGTGGNLASLAMDYRCVGIDASADAIALARMRFPGIQFVHGTAPDDLGDTARAARLFLLMDVLEHVRDDFELFSHVCGAAQPGAYFLITVPAETALWSDHDVNLGHFRRYDRGRLQLLWKDWPIEPVLVAPFNTRLYPVVRAVRTINRWMRRTSGASGTDLTLPPGPVNKVLARILAGESEDLVDHLEGNRGDPAGRGVSLIAVLRRGTGQIPLRRRPANLPPDLHEPEPPHGSRA